MQAWLQRLTVVLLLGCAPIFAQAPRLEPDAPPAQPSIATVTFTLDFPNANPPHYSLAIDSVGRATYESTPPPNEPGEPYTIQFTASEPTRTRIFDAARKLNYFKGDFEYRKGRIAFSGTKTLSYKDAHQQNVTTYNWSDNTVIQQLTRLFQDISMTLEFGSDLEHLYKYDKLGIDAELRQMIDASTKGELLELQAIAPILQKIADDPGIIHIARQRASTLLAKVQTPNTQAANQSQH